VNKFLILYEVLTRTSCVFSNSRRYQGGHVAGNLNIFRS